MASKIINSQLRHSMAKFAQNAQMAVDPLFPAGHASVQSPVVYERKEIDITSKVGFGSSFTQRLPQQDYIGECYLEVKVSQSAGSEQMCEYPGLAFLERMTLKNTTTIQEYDLLPVYEYMLNKMRNEQRDTIYEVVGGTAFVPSVGGDSFLVPIPVFWSKLMDRSNEPLPAHILNSPVELECRVRSKVDLLQAGATAGNFALVSVKLRFIQYETSDTQLSSHLSQRDAYNFKTFDFQTISNNIVQSGSKTKLDLTAFDGDLSHLQISCQTQANRDTNKYYFRNEDIDELILNFDGNEYSRLESDKQMTYEHLVLYGGHGNHSAANKNETYIMSFGIDIQDPRAYSGSLNTNDLNALHLDVTHSVGSACYVDVMAVRNVRLTIVNRHLLRLK